MEARFTPPATAKGADTIASRIVSPSARTPSRVRACPIAGLEQTSRPGSQPRYIGVDGTAKSERSDYSIHSKIYEGIAASGIPSRTGTVTRGGAKDRLWGSVGASRTGPCSQPSERMAARSGSPIDGWIRLSSPGPSRGVGPDSKDPFGCSGFLDRPRTSR